MKISWRVIKYLFVWFACCFIMLAFADLIRLRQYILGGPEYLAAKEIDVSISGVFRYFSGAFLIAVMGSLVYTITHFALLNLITYFLKDHYNRMLLSLGIGFWLGLISAICVVPFTTLVLAGHDSDNIREVGISVYSICLVLYSLSLLVSFLLSKELLAERQGRMKTDQIDLRRVVILEMVCLNCGEEFDVQGYSEYCPNCQSNDIIEQRALKYPECYQNVRD